MQRQWMTLTCFPLDIPLFKRLCECPHSHQQYVVLALVHRGVVLPHITTTTSVHHTPLGRFSMLDFCTVGIVSVPKKPALESYRRELSGDVSFGIRTLLVVEQSSFENRPRVCVCDIHSRTTTGMQRQQYALTCCSPKSTHYLYTTVYIISPPPWGGFQSSTAQQPKRGRQ